MVGLSGFERQMRAMTYMSTTHVITTRRTIITGLASGAGLLLAGCPAEPPTYGNVLRMADNFTYRAQRLLLPSQSLAREYDSRDINSIPAIGTTDPADLHQGAYNEKNGVIYQQLRDGQFADWRLRMVGDCRMGGRAPAQGPGGGRHAAERAVRELLRVR